MRNHHLPLRGSRLPAASRMDRAHPRPHERTLFIREAPRIHYARLAAAAAHVAGMGPPAGGDGS